MFSAGAIGEHLPVNLRDPGRLKKPDPRLPGNPLAKQSDERRMLQGDPQTSVRIGENHRIGSVARENGESAARGMEFFAVEGDLEVAEDLEGRGMEPFT